MDNKSIRSNGKREVACITMKKQQKIIGKCSFLTQFYAKGRFVCGMVLVRRNLNYGSCL